MKRILKHLVSSVTRTKEQLFRPDYDAGISATRNLEDCATEQLIAHAIRLAIAGNSDCDHSTVYVPDRLPVFILSDAATKDWVRCNEQQNTANLERLKQRVTEELHKSFPIYSIQSQPLTPEFDWSFNHAIPGSDIQYRKHIHRFGFLPRLSLCAIYGGVSAERCSEILKSWTTFAASSQGNLCFNSNLAVIQRVVATLFSLKIIAALNDAERRPVCEILFSILVNDIRFIWPRLRNSYGNNHLMGDCFAGWLLVLFLGDDKSTSEPVLDYLSHWTDELLRQTYPDGGSFEHSGHYQEFACEMGTLYLILCLRNNMAIAPEVLGRIEQLLLFQIAIGGCEDKPLYFGDSIEDTFIPIALKSAMSPGFYREIYRLIFDQDIPSADAANPATEAASWLTADLNVPLQLSKNKILNDSALQVLPDTGLAYFRDKNQNAELLFRTGPAPEVNLSAGHAHSDLMSITLRIGDEFILVDPGTYSYRADPSKWSSGEPCWRRYFQGPEAHNCLFRSGFDPLGNMLKGDFRPANHPARANTTVLSSNPALISVDAELLGVPELTGYRRGVVHIPGRFWLVYDLIDQEMHFDRANWQFSPAVSLEVQERGCLAHTTSGKKITLCCNDALVDPQILKGSTDPLGGWVSEGYGKIEEAPQLRFSLKNDANLATTLFGIGDKRATSINAQRDDAEITFTIESDSCREILVMRNDIGPVTTAEPLEIFVVCRMCYLRYQAGKLSEIRALDVKKLSLSNSLELEYDNPESWLIIRVKDKDFEIHSASNKSN